MIDTTTSNRITDGPKPTQSEGDSSRTLLPFNDNQNNNTIQYYNIFDSKIKFLDTSLVTLVNSFL